jgi:hypothetical protein
MVQIVIDNANYDAEAGEHLIDVINRTGREIPQVMVALHIPITASLRCAQSHRVRDEPLQHGAPP